MLSDLLSQRSVLLPTNMISTSDPRSVLTSSIHFKVRWNELASKTYVKSYITVQWLISKETKSNISNCSYLYSLKNYEAWIWRFLVKMHHFAAIHKLLTRTWKKIRHFISFLMKNHTSFIKYIWLKTIKSRPSSWQRTREREILTTWLSLVFHLAYTWLWYFMLKSE